MILEELRNDVRTYLDVDAEDLPDQLIARFAREAHRRIMSAVDHWSFLEYDWSFSTSASTDEYDLTALSSTAGELVDEIHTLRRSTGSPLPQIGPTEARRRFPNDSNSGTPYYWRRANDKIVLFPTPTTTETIYVEGWRKPFEWVDGENGYVSDFPDQFDDVIFNYVLGKAYMQQEDPDQGLTSLDLADEILRRLVKRENDMQGEPIVIGSRRRAGGTGLPSSHRYDWE